ncbi:YdbC family protein [Brevibacillus formosus]|uniref:YdbC family protein n=1 Tax=Brevibacillus formosus TaxID=54913 RepID=UPI003F1B9037
MEMLIKWITCKVSESQKQSFSLAQEKWRPLEGIEGFLGQIGGWNQDQPLEACILAFWENIHHYQSFMEKEHDPIFHQSGQSETYEAILVELFSKSDDRQVRGILEDIAASQILHVAHVEEKGEFPEAEGMLGGVVGQSLKNSNQYVKASLWKHEQLPSSEVSAVENGQRYTIVLEPAWRIVKKGGAK